MAMRVLEGLKLSELGVPRRRVWVPVKTQLLQSVDGKKTLYELCSQGPKPAADIAKMLYAFQILHLICPKGQAPAERQKPARHGPVKIKLGSGEN